MRFSGKIQSMNAVQTAPIRFGLWPVHKHKFALLIEDAESPEWPHDMEQVVIAVCQCGRRLMAAEIERVLDESEM